MNHQQSRQTQQQNFHRQNQVHPSKNIEAQNHANTQGYRPESMRMKSHYLTTYNIRNFTQTPSRAERIETTRNPYLMGGSSVTHNKPLMVFTGTDREYSVEDFLNAATANLILNICPEPISTPLHLNCIHRCTALLQTTLDDAVQKCFSVLPIEFKTDWKQFTQEFSRMFDSDRNKEHQRVFCNESPEWKNKITRSKNQNCTTKRHSGKHMITKKRKWPKFQWWPLHHIYEKLQ